MKKIVLSLVVVVGLCASSLVAAKVEAKEKGVLLSIHNNTNEPAYFKITYLKKRESGYTKGYFEIKAGGKIIGIYGVPPNRTFKGLIGINEDLHLRALMRLSIDSNQVIGAKIRVMKDYLKDAKTVSFDYKFSKTQIYDRPVRGGKFTLLNAPKLGEPNKK